MRSILTQTVLALTSVVAASGIVAFSDPAVASVGINSTRQMVVQTHDLDLSSPDGRSIAQQRIHRAAAAVCDSDEVPAIQADQCRARALGGAERQLRATIAGR